MEVRAVNFITFITKTVDGAIHHAAGYALHRACLAIGGCDPGDSKLTRGYKLPARYVVCYFTSQGFTLIQDTHCWPYWRGRRGSIQLLHVVS